MSEQDKDLAKEHAARAARQAKHAARNVGEAAEFEKDHLVDSVNKAADPIDPHGLATVLADLGGGIFASMVAVVSAAIATKKFRAAYEGRNRMVRR
jgi:hypothetical protein